LIDQIFINKNGKPDYAAGFQFCDIYFTVLLGYSPADVLGVTPGMPPGLVVTDMTGEGLGTTVGVPPGDQPGDGILGVTGATLYVAAGDVPGGGL
jgi:hypothetical protein